MNNEQLTGEERRSATTTPALRGHPSTEGNGEPDALKVCYYCGKKVSADAPKCDRCGNDRSFTWTKIEV